ncbi:MAG TPA: 50S ribosomal protein L3 [Candidatus Acidoferrales bacterium]|nr:50S ribosomal protein L3 [Candidatus Acidoferrales bacterium]
MAVNGILGIKLGMAQVFGEDGTSIPCTVLQAGPCVVVDRRTKDKHGYDAVQLGLVEFIKPQRVNKAMSGHFKKAGVAPMRFLGEFRLEESKDEAKAGDRVLVDRFKVGEFVDVAGTSKGRGFAGGVKRWRYAGGDASHGSMFHRAPGGIGASSFPSRVWKNQHFPGHLGNERKTSKNLKVVKIDADENLLFVRGAVPGPAGGYIYVRKAKNAK